jgi:hypothetical protein
MLIMPSDPPPIPDALRAGAPAPRKPAVNILADPFNPPPEATHVPKANAEDEPEAKSREEKPASGLAEFDAPHAFASVLASGLGRSAALVLTCMITFGLTAACHRVSLLFQGWREGGFSGFFHAVISVPGSVFTAPGEWFVALGNGILEPLGVPYLMLFVGGLILAIRSEIHIVKLMLFYTLLGSIHAAAYLKMKHPISILLWVPLLVGYLWAYRWYWRQQIQVEDIDELPESTEE